MLGLYHRLPPSLQSLAASARGLYLRSWRYGGDLEDIVAEAISHEQWDAAMWTRWRAEATPRLLHRAATRVPWYRAHWNARRRQGDRASWEVLENWPILEKRTVKGAAREFLADDCDARKMFREHTSGSTGLPLDLWWSRPTVRRWYGYFEARWRRWYGVSRASRWANIGGQVVVPVARSRPPYWVWNHTFHQLYCSSYHLAPGAIGAYLDALERYRIEYLFGYTSSLHALATGANALGRAVPMRVVVSNAEPVFPHQREAIERAFACPLRETYGMAEIVTAASECASGALHLWPEAGIVEMDDGDSCGTGVASGELVCTGLMNPDMPLIRYRVGDRATRADDETPCGCGRTLPRVLSIDGRNDDVLVTPDGRSVGRLDPVFKGGLPILEAQIVQTGPARILLRIVPAAGYSADTAEAIRARVRERMGAVTIDIETLPAIPREANGKFKSVISLIPKETAG
jgi:phenylacetate-CoA ligase